MKRKGILIIAMLAALLFSGCAGGNDTALGSMGTERTEPGTVET